jgi:hypothetical protein
MIIITFKILNMTIKNHKNPQIIINIYWGYARYNQKPLRCKPITSERSYLEKYQAL